MGTVSELDVQNINSIRKNVSNFVAKAAQKYDTEDSRVLDIAPQDHEGAAPYFTKATIDTLDIDPASGATYIADLCQNNQNVIPSNQYDVIICTEVLEHTLQPFNAVEELKRLLKPGGVVLVSAPFNFRIHGPLPDCWRFTEHGLRALFASFSIISLDALESNDRFLMPVHYTLVAAKKANEQAQS